MKFKGYLVLFFLIFFLPLGVFLISQTTRITPQAETQPFASFGFVPVDVDIEQTSNILRTSTYYTYDYNQLPNKKIHTISKNTSDADPTSIQLLMDNGLNNFGFESDLSSWQQETSGNGVVSTDPGIFNRAVSLTTNSSNLIRIKQEFRESIRSGEYGIFGVWVKTPNPNSVDIYLEDSEGQKFTGIEYREYNFPNVNLGPIEENMWTFVRGWGKASRDGKFKVVLEVSNSNRWALFDNVAVAIVGDSQNSNQTIANIVEDRPRGLTWLIGNEPGFEAQGGQTTAQVGAGNCVFQHSGTTYIRPVSSAMYALLYRQFWTTIKRVDPQSRVGLGGVAYDDSNCFRPIPLVSGQENHPSVFMDSWRKSYREFFGSEPPLDIMNVHFYETTDGQVNQLRNYLTLLRQYTNNVSGWQNKPIWLTEYGVIKNAGGNGVNFINQSNEFLKNNNLNIEKWFWFDPCGRYDSNLVTLLDCSNMSLTQAGQAFVTQAGIQTTPTSTPVATNRPLGQCNSSCDENRPCASGFQCWGGECRNSQCLGTESCICSQLSQDEQKIDFDGNGKIEIFDYVILVEHFNPERTDTDVHSDTDSDGDVDIFDYSFFLTVFANSQN